MSTLYMSEKPVKTTVPSLKKKLIKFMRTLQHVPADAKSDMEEVIALLQRKEVQISPANAVTEVEAYINLLFREYPALQQANKESSEQLKRSAKLFALKAVELTNKGMNNKHKLS